MKKIILLMMISVPILAQTEYELTPGSKGNQIILSVENESKNDCVEGVKVSAVKIPQSIEMKNTVAILESVSGKRAEEALFLFDVARIPKSLKDTIRFAITDKLGSRWNKEIVVKYALPTEFKLEQNYPNPFNPETTIEFTIPEKGSYNLSVYNILGQVVNELANDLYEAGYYKVTFDASKLASGIYIYRLSGNKANLLKKMVVVK